MIMVMEKFFKISSPRDIATRIVEMKTLEEN